MSFWIKAGCMWASARQVAERRELYRRSTTGCSVALPVRMPATAPRYAAPWRRIELRNKGHSSPTAPLKTFVPYAPEWQSGKGKKKNFLAPRALRITGLYWVLRRSDNRVRLEQRLELFFFEFSEVYIPLFKVVSKTKVFYLQYGDWRT